MKDSGKRKTTLIYGKHAVSEALLKMPEIITKIFYKDKMSLMNMEDVITDKGIEMLPFDKVGMTELPRHLVMEANHQGIFAEILIEKLVTEYKTFIESVRVDSDKAFLLLGEIEDPQNVGAVIRSAAAMGFSAVLFPEHNQAPINGTVVKVSAGNAFNIPLVQIGNVNTTIADLKDKGFWIYGLDGKSSQTIEKEKFDRPTVFVLGKESTGLREKTAESCDVLLSIPMHQKTESLNAATSAAIVMHQWSLQHKNALEN